MCFLSTTFPNAPAHPPAPLYFLTRPLSARIMDGLSNGGDHLLVNTWENEKKNK